MIITLMYTVLLSVNLPVCLLVFTIIIQASIKSLFISVSFTVFYIFALALPGVPKSDPYCFVIIFIINRNLEAKM